MTNCVWKNIFLILMLLLVLVCEMRLHVLVQNSLARCSYLYSECDWLEFRLDTD